MGALAELRELISPDGETVAPPALGDDESN